jgi:DNA-binding XRE family transcriptional regulator
MSQAQDTRQQLLIPPAGDRAGDPFSLARAALPPIIRAPTESRAASLGLKGYSHVNRKFGKPLRNVDLPSQLADSLRRLREGAGLSQMKLAKTLGISQATLNRLENGSQNVTLKTIGRLCAALRCQVAELFEGPLELPSGSRKVRAQIPRLRTHRS